MNLRGTVFALCLRKRGEDFTLRLKTFIHHLLLPRYFACKLKVLCGPHNTLCLVYRGGNNLPKWNNSMASQERGSQSIAPKPVPSTLPFTIACLTTAPGFLQIPLLALWFSLYPFLNTSMDPLCIPSDLETSASSLPSPFLYPIMSTRLP